MSARTQTFRDAADAAGGRASLAHHLRALRAEVAEWSEAGVEGLTDTLAQWLTAHHAVAARRAAEEAPDGEIPLSVLRALIADVVALRKGDHSAARLAVEQERLKLEREKSREWMEKQFEEWLKEPEVKKRIFANRLTDEDRERRMREIFGLTEPKPRGLSPEAVAEIERAASFL